MYSIISFRELKCVSIRYIDSITIQNVKRLRKMWKETGKISGSGSSWTYLKAYLYDIWIIYHKYVILSEQVCDFSCQIPSPQPPTPAKAIVWLVCFTHGHLNDQSLQTALFQRCCGIPLTIWNLVPAKHLWKSQTQDQLN